MRTHELVLRQVEADLAAGKLRLGDRLPGERAMAGQLGVSRPSVREAIRVLEAMGVVRTAVGSGPDAGAVIVADPGSPLTAALRLHLATSHLPMGDIVQTRVLLESWAVREAAGRATPAQVAAARQLLDAMDEPDLPRERFHLLDAEFHVALASLADNVLVSTIMASLREAIHGYVIAAAPNVPDWTPVATMLRAQHRAVLAAVAEGDGDLAAQLVAEHIEGFYKASRLA
ncbi:FadR/GntR family transcriptional regulator [Jiangella sp. DSM 45060]|uniref:FadR/GntR family transcriptional regulator n=1 Tax=Jiangella sp. DSM 45060 TaxID=1798224 RepID=UPI00087B2BC7|nr:FCD domain-containing protein [Jiangella sp. DSM 45060]SDT64749.1 transcriptional regulator, GntR family [Jiangella sp. DSM 45060]